MRQKELRLALICYGGVSLAIYMHGITKEVWKLAQASRDFQSDGPGGARTDESSRGHYHDLLTWIESESGVRLRVLPDIIAGASAGGINGVFLSHAIVTGQSLEPLTDLWLENADVDQLLDPDARPLSRMSKIWAEPIAWYALGRRGGTLERTVSAAAREEVKAKMSRLVRARWFAPPFGGKVFSTLILDALEAMEATGGGPPLLPTGQPLDLFVTVTDFVGHPERLALHSPERATEMEHRVAIGFSTRRQPPGRIGAHAALAFAARATASFPGAFPPFTARELDALLIERGAEWPGREAFLKRILPQHWRAGTAEDAVLIDGSVLANAPFAQAIDALKNRPAKREVDRRFVYIDPKPDLVRFKSDEPRADDTGTAEEPFDDPRLPGFFATIFGAISNIPREQPIRDNLNAIAGRSQRIIQMRSITDNLRGEVEANVEAIFGRTLFLDKPTARRLAIWQRKSRVKAAKMAGFSWVAYAHLRLSTVVEDIAGTLRRLRDDSEAAPVATLRDRVWDEVRARGRARVSTKGGGPSPELTAFFQEHDVGYRIRRLRFLARRLSEDRDQQAVRDGSALEAMHDTIYACLSLYLKRETGDWLHARLDEGAFDGGTADIEWLAAARDLAATDTRVDEKLAAGLADVDAGQRRALLLAFLGFPFYDAATLPLLQGEGFDEFDPIKVDRVSPEDARSIRDGGVAATLKGIEFNNFGAFFSRSYRENDYLWGRLHGAERMTDIVLSTLPENQRPGDDATLLFKKQMFLAIVDEEAGRLTHVDDLIASLRREIAMIGIEPEA